MAIEKKTPTLIQSLIPLIALAFFLAFGYGVLGLRAEILLLAGALIAAIVALLLGYSYKELEQGIVDNIMKGMPAILTIIVVGALIGSWMIAGTIPMFIYYGMEFISPAYFLVSACLVCSIVSLVTGSSFGTVGTLGVALIGVATGLGVPLGQAAGAIVAGAYFGDKLSPFSDTTNLAPIAAQSNLYDHIQHTLWTTTPAWLLGLLCYLVLGLTSETTQDVNTEPMLMVLSGINEQFEFSFALLLPAVITLGGAILKLPIIPSLLASCAVAILLALGIQDASLVDSISATVLGYKVSTDHVILDSLLNRGGMMQMMNVILLAFCAFAFGGIMIKAQMMEVILVNLSRIAHTTTKLIAVTILSSITTAILTGSAWLSILIPGEMLAPVYRKMNLAAKNLSRTTEDSGTIIVPLVPWSIAGVFMAGTLGVETVAYAPWAVMCYASSVFAMLYGYTGFAISKRLREDETTPGS